MKLISFIMIAVAIGIAWMIGREIGRELERARVGRGWGP